MNFNMNFLAMLTFIYGLTGERISIQVFRSLKKEAKPFTAYMRSCFSLKQNNKMAQNLNPLEETASILCIARSILYLISG